MNKIAEALLNSFRYWVDQLLRRGKIDKKLRSSRYQLIYAARLVHETEEVPALASNNVTRYVKKMLPKFKDLSTAERSFEVPIQIVSRLRGTPGKDGPRASGFTQAVKVEVDCYKAGSRKAKVSVAGNA